MLGIIGAMDEEVAMIKAQLTDVQVESRAAMDFYKGKLEEGGSSGPLRHWQGQCSYVHPDFGRYI